MRLTLKQLNSLYTFKAPTDTKELLLKKEHVYIDADPIVHAFLEAKYREIIKAHDIEEVIRHLQRATILNEKKLIDSLTKFQ